MTAPFLSRFGTPIVSPDSVAVSGRDALAHLERPIRHCIPGTLWERVAESVAVETAPKPCSTCGSAKPCIMCHGSKVYPYRPGSGATVWGECGACWGTGIDHD